MPDEPGSSPATTPASRRIGLLLAVLVPILGLTYFGLPLVSRFLAAPYVVTAGDARYYPDRPWGMSPGPLTLEIDVECNRRRPIPFCEMVVDSISDDAGNDLLAGPLHVKPFATHPPHSTVSYSGKQSGNSISGGGNVWPGSTEIRHFTWNVEVPRLPRPDIKSIHLIGHIGLWEGGEQRQIRVLDLAFKAGTTFQIDGRTAEIIDFVEAGKGSDSGSCYIVIRDDGLFFERAECQSGGHTEIEDKPSRKALPRWPDEPLKGFFFSFSTPPGATRGDVTFHCRINPQYQILPVDLHYPIVPTKDDGPFAGDTMPSRRRPNDQDWGTPLPTDRYPATHADVAVTEVDRDLLYPETSIDISIKTEGADQPIASDIRIDRLHDMAGHDFLAPAPWKTSDYLSLSIAPDIGESSEPRYDLRVWTTGKVQGTGVYRLAFGSDKTTVTIPGRISSAGGGDPIDLPVARLLPQRTLSDSIEFKVEGNLGLVREITALDANGKVLGSDTTGAHPFYRRDCWLHVPLHGKPEEIRQWKITYFHESSWLERPFEFSVDGPASSSGPRE